MNALIRKFLSSYQPYRRLLTYDILTAILSAAIALVIPLVIRHITGDVLTGDAALLPRRLMEMGVVLIALIALQACCTYVYDYLGHAMGARWSVTCGRSFSTTTRSCRFRSTTTRGRARFYPG